MICIHLILTSFPSIYALPKAASLTCALSPAAAHFLRDLAMSLLSPTLLASPVVHIHSELPSILKKQKQKQNKQNTPSTLCPNLGYLLLTSLYSQVHSQNLLVSDFCLHHSTNISHSQAKNNFHLIIFLKLYSSCPFCSVWHHMPFWICQLPQFAAPSSPASLMLLLTPWLFYFWSLMPQVAAFAPLLFLCGVLESSHPFCALITSKILILRLDLHPEFQGYLSYSLMVRSSRLPHVSSSMSVTGLIITFQPLPAPCHLSLLHLYPGFVLKWFPSLKPQAPLCLLPLSHLSDTKFCWFISYTSL